VPGSPDVLVLVLAGGEGGRLELLTEHRAKPATPFAGVYRLIDFPLSHAVHSGLADVWVLQQYEPHSLTEHLANGRPWDLDRTYGGLLLLHPHTGSEGEGWHRGNAHAIWQKRSLIRELDPELLLVTSADHVYRLDYAAVLEAHRERAADVTVVTTEVPVDEASRFGCVTVDRDGRVTDFAYKPDDPPGGTITTEDFVFRTDRLLEVLEALAEEADPASDESRLQDFGHGLLPDLVQAGKAFAFPLEGYWRDVGTVASYWEGHMDLLEPGQGPELDDPAWPILTRAIQRRPARIEGSARIERSLISPGCTVLGTVVRSVLAPGVVVEAGAEVVDSVLLHDVVVAEDARVAGAIVDVEARIGKGARVGEPIDADPAEQLVLVGARERVRARARVRPGGRVPSG
jgi:glucose-1-phosphate adenylyltransferase